MRTLDQMWPTPESLGGLHRRPAVRNSWSITGFLGLAMPIAFALAIVGCATVQPLTGQTSAPATQNIAPMMQEAGFTPLPATTPAETERLKQLPADKLGYYVDQGGAANYWLADPDQCHCIYHGDTSAYLRYEDIELRDELADEQNNQRNAYIAQSRPQVPVAGFGPPGFGGPGFGGPGFGGSGFGIGFGGGGGFGGSGLSFSY